MRIAGGFGARSFGGHPPKSIADRGLGGLTAQDAIVDILQPIEREIGLIFV